MSFISLGPSSALWTERGRRRMTDEEVMARIVEAVPEWDEPYLCRCGKHYMGAPCPEENGNG